MKIFLAILGIIFIVFTLKSFWISHILSILLSVAAIVCNVVFLPEGLLIPCVIFSASVLCIFGELIFDEEETEEPEGRKGRRCRASIGFSTEFFGFGLVISLIVTVVAALIFAFGGGVWIPLCYILPAAVVVGDVLLIKYLG